MEGCVGCGAPPAFTAAAAAARSGGAARSRAAAPSACRLPARQPAAAPPRRAARPHTASTARLPARRPAPLRPGPAPRRGGALSATLEPEEGPGWWEHGSQLPNNRVIRSTPDLLDALSTAGDRLVVVHFYASWCAACRTLHPKLVQLVEARDDILWLKVSYDDNKPMSRSLGVKVLPHFQMYRGPSGRVAEFSCSLSKVQKLRDALEEHGTSRCFLGDATPSLPTELTNPTVEAPP